MDLTCPKCRGVMRSYERNGVTVDQCAECRGLFLDRGELERLIDAENRWHSGSSEGSRSPARPQESYGGSGYSGHKKRRKSFLEDLFD